MDVEILSEIFVGQKFNSYSNLQSFVKQYEIERRQKFAKKRSRTIKAAAKKRFICERLVYYDILYVCIHGGGEFTSKGRGIRKTSTLKMNCPVKFKVSASKDGLSLVVIEANMNHEGHGFSQKVYEYLPQIRKLNDTEQSEVEQYLEMGGNPKIIQNKIRTEHHKNVVLKDLHNIKYKLKKNSNDLNIAVKLLQETYKANVSIFHDKDGNFEALYFSTENMRHAMSAWPEIIFIDGTYKLLDIGLTVMILLVEDSNALSEVVGVCLLHHEDYLTFKWFLNTFKAENQEACSHIRCFMGDKDLLERDVIKEVFVGIPIYICIFHTLKTFKRQISTEKLEITRQEKEVCLSILEKLVYSTSEQNYQELYDRLCDCAPDKVVDYFTSNWHPIRNEWTVFNMIQGNFKNTTNNRLESINEKIKKVVLKNSSLSMFLKNFFLWLNSHNEERNNKVSKLILKKPVVQYDENSCEMKYINLLTEYAYKYVLNQCSLSNKVTVLEEEGNYKVTTKQGQIFVYTTSCECGDFSSMMLPCRHLLALRRKLDISLFCEEACSKRWQKDYYLKHHRVLQTSEPHIPVGVSISSKKTVKKIMNASEKRKKVNLITNNLVNLACLSSNSNFLHKLNCLKEIELLWRQGHEVKIEKVDIGQSATEELDIGSPEMSRQFELGTSFPGELPIIINEIEVENSAVEFIIESRASDEIRPEFRTSSEITRHLEEAPTSPEIPTTTEIPSGSNELNVKNQDIQVTDIKMPAKIRRKGRPSGIDSTVIGVNKGKCSKIPLQFQKKSKKEKQYHLLKQLVENENDPILIQCLEGEYLLQIIDIQKIENMSHILLDPLVNMELLKPLMDKATFSYVTNFIINSSNNYTWCCIFCKNLLSEMRSIRCDSCLGWYHFKCVNLKQVPQRKTWFCKDCY